MSEARILGFNYGQLQANGADLRFSDMAGSELPYEIDTWDSSGTSYVWVRVAELVDSTTTIMMHWGNDAAEKPEYDGAESVWANGYVGVWHLGDAGNGRNNSTGAGYNGVADSSGVAATGAGLIGRADIFSGTTTGRANNAPTTGGITCGNLSITGSQSVEAWIKPTDMSQRRIVVAKAYGGEGSMVLETDGRVRFFQGSAGSDTTPHDTHSTPLEAIVNERWSHVMHVRDSTSEPAMLHWYINGELVNSQEQTLAIRGSTLSFYVGKGYVYSFNGLLDEVRISNTSRSSDWVAAGYQMVAANEEFISFIPIATGDILTVTGYPQAFGVAAPPYGVTNGLAHDDTFGCTVTEAVVIDSGIRAHSTGYHYYTNGMESGGAPYHSGSEHGFSYQHDSEHAFPLLVWQWQKEYEVAASAAAGGILSTNGGWYAEGSTVTIEAIATAGYEFYLWEGNVPQGMEREPELTFFASEPVSVVAHFREALQVEGDIWYVALDGDDNNDGTSWATAKARIEATLAVASEGDYILVGPGTYNYTSQLIVDQGVTLLGVDGAEETIIRRSSGDFRLIAVTHGAAVLEGFTITGATRGGIHINGGGTLRNSIVRNNSHNNADPRQGAGVWISGGLVQNCRIFNNTLSYDGGHGGYGAGIYAAGGALVESCIISNNVAGNGSATDGGGSGAYITGATTTLRNSLIVGNTYNTHESNAHVAINGGGVCLLSGTVENCTIVGNHYKGSRAGGLYNSGGTVRNTIIWGNTNLGGINNYLNSGTTHYSFSLSSPLLPGEGNLAVDPNFVDATGNDYRLKFGAAVNSGSNQIWMDGAQDLAGAARVVGTAVDLGAYEYHPDNGMECWFTVSPAVLLEAGEVEFKAFVADAGEEPLTYHWSFDNGAEYDLVGSDQAVATNFYTVPGIYTVRLKVTDSAAGEATVVREECIRVVPRTLYVSEESTPVPPYASWATAANSPLDAVEMATAGALILVSNGTYSISRQINLLEPIELRSVNGAAVTTIRRGSGTTCPLYLNNSGAVVDGFTLRDGTQGGVLIHSGGGSISNCVIRDNTGVNNQTLGAGILMRGAGLIYRSSIINNTLKCSAGVAHNGGGIYMTAGRVEECVVTNNICNHTSPSKDTLYADGGGIYMSGASSLIRNTLIAGNRSTSGSSGVHMTAGTLESATIVGNKTTRTFPGDTAGGLYRSGGTVLNTIIYDNWWNDDVLNLRTGDTYDYLHTLLEPGGSELAGEGNIAGDPLFVAPETGDYRLGNKSPAIGRGLNQEWMEDGVDLAGQARIFGKQVDIGAYENTVAPGSVIVVR